MRDNRPPADAPHRRVKMTIRLSPELADYLDQVRRKRGRGTTRTSLIREGIRRLIDEEEDVIGSRRHFQKSLQAHLDRMQAALLEVLARQPDAPDSPLALVTFHLHALLHMEAFGWSVLLPAIIKEPVSAQKLIERALMAARRDEARLHAKIRATRESQL